MPMGSLQGTFSVIKNNAWATAWGLCYKKVLFPVSACATQDCKGKILIVEGLAGRGSGSVAVSFYSSDYLHLLSPVAHSGTFGQRDCLGKFLGNWKK